MKSCSRRTFAGAAALAGVALPFLRILSIDPFAERVARAAPSPRTPRRFAFFYVANGYTQFEGGDHTAGGSNWVHDIGQAGANETTFNLGAATAPLAPLKSELVILEGLDFMISRSRGGPQYPGSQLSDTHTIGLVHLLTTGGNLVDCGDLHACAAPGGVLGVQFPSIDQYLAQKVGGLTMFPSIQLGVRESDGSSISFSKAGKATDLPPDNDPVHVFKRLFGNFSPMGPDPALKTRLALRKSVLDNVTTDIGALRGRLGADDGAKFDSHLASVRALELRLATTSTAAACTKPNAPTPVDLNNNTNYPAIIRAQTDVLFNAFACDLTRIATLQFGQVFGTNACNFPPVSSNTDHHLLSHAGDGTGKQQFQAVRVLEYQQIVDFATRLKNTPEADGSGMMLDNTLIVVGSEIGSGHIHEGLPFITIGGKNMGVRTGRYLKMTHQPHNKLFVSVLNAMGVMDTSYGNPVYGIGPLSGLLA